MKEQQQVSQPPPTVVPPEIEKDRLQVNLNVAQPQPSNNSAKKSNRRPLFLKVDEEEKKKNTNEVIDLNSDENFGFF